MQNYEAEEGVVGTVEPIVPVPFSPPDVSFVAASVPGPVAAVVQDAPPSFGGAGALRVASSRGASPTAPWALHSSAISGVVRDVATAAPGATHVEGVAPTSDKPQGEPSPSVAGSVKGGGPARSEVPASVPAAPSDLFPRNGRERELCDRASRPDWLYLGLGPLSVAGSIFAESALKYSETAAGRMVGAPIVGLSWGFLLGSIAPSLPRCSYAWVDGAPAEGTARAEWPLALSMALLGGFSAPLFMGVEYGPAIPAGHTVGHRQGRVALAAAGGFLGALIPYVLPPAPYRAARELMRLRWIPVESGAAFGIGGSF